MASNKSGAKNGTAANNHHNNNNNNISNNNNNNDKSKNGSTVKKKKSKKQPPQKQIKIKKPKTRDSGCCSINFIKYVLIIIDIVFFVSIYNCFNKYYNPPTHTQTRKKFEFIFISCFRHFFVTEHFSVLWNGQKRTLKKCSFGYLSLLVINFK